MLGFSIIKETLVKEIGFEYDPTVEDEDSLMTSYELIGQIRLDCRSLLAPRKHKDHVFYIVEDARAPVIIGNTSPLYQERLGPKGINMLIGPTGKIYPAIYSMSQYRNKRLPLLIA
jgi:hypothetical protein